MGGGDVDCRLHDIAAFLLLNHFLLLSFVLSFLLIYSYSYFPFALGTDEVARLADKQKWEHWQQNLAIRGTARGVGDEAEKSWQRGEKGL